MTTEAVAIVLAIGGLLPLLTAAVQQPQWTARTRTVLSVAISVLAGIVGYVSVNGMDFSTPSKVVTWVVGVVLISSTSYKTLWQPSGVAPAVESITSHRTSE